MFKLDPFHNPHHFGVPHRPFEVSPRNPRFKPDQSKILKMLIARTASGNLEWHRKMEYESWDTDVEDFIHFRIRKGIVYVINDLHGTEDAIIVEPSNRDLFFVLMTVIKDGMEELRHRQHSDIIQVIEEASADDIQWTFAELLDSNPREWYDTKIEYVPEDVEGVEPDDRMNKPKPQHHHHKPHPDDDHPNYENHHPKPHPHSEYFRQDPRKYRPDPRPHGDEYFTQPEGDYPEYDNLLDTHTEIIEDENGIEVPPRPFEPLNGEDFPPPFGKPHHHHHRKP